MRGTIEVARNNRISGWVYSKDADLRDSLVLAFTGESCAGSGRIGLFRPDLLQAGLGHGYLGFDFEVDAGGKPERLFIRLEDSDFALLQHDTVAGGSRATAFPPMSKEEAERGLRRWKWLLARGCVSQSEYDFVRSISTVGTYVRTLKVRPSGGELQVVDPLSMGRELLSAYSLCEVRVASEKVRSNDSESVLSALQARKLSCPVVGLHCSNSASVRVEEGSQVDDGRSEAAGEFSALVSYELRPDYLLFLDLRCRCLSTDRTDLTLLFSEEQLA